MPDVKTVGPSPLGLKAEYVPEEMIIADIKRVLPSNSNDEGTLLCFAGYIGHYRQAALNAVHAGMDGVKSKETLPEYLRSHTEFGQSTRPMATELSFKLLDAFVAAGGNFIDTANNYQNEESEIWLGEWMEERKNRERLVIATKYGSHYRSHALGKDEAINNSGSNKRSLHMSVRDSLKKLKTDFIDILYLHWWDWSTSIEELMDSLHNLVQQGKVLYLGISDTPAWVVAAANTYAKKSGKTPFCVYQVLQLPLTILSSRADEGATTGEREILPMALHFGMALAPWDVLGGGRLHSKSALKARKAEGEKIRAFINPIEQTEKEVKYSEALDRIAKVHGVGSVTTVALAYILSKAPYVFPIVGGRKVEQLHENIKALTLKLSAAEIKELENVETFEPGFPYGMIGNDPAVSGEGAWLLKSVGTIDYVRKPKAVGYE
ncbi:hypothetical protein P7C70_g8340, partial [Phenoliferia sp. Uapishka_3]